MTSSFKWITLDTQKQGGVPDASVLREMSRQEGSKEPQEHHHEERQTGDTGGMPGLRHQDVPNRKVKRGPQQHWFTEVVAPLSEQLIIARL